MEATKNKGYTLWIIYAVFIIGLILLSCTAKVEGQNVILRQGFEQMLSDNQIRGAVNMLYFLVEMQIEGENIATIILQNLEKIIFDNIYVLRQEDESIYEYLCICYQNLDCY